MERTTLVIGGNSGIGLEIVKLLSSLGEQVIVAGRSHDNIESLPGVSCQAYDVTDDSATLDLPEALDGLVYCPGTINLKPFGRLANEDFQSEFQINFFGAVNVIRQAHPALKKSGAGSIVLFSTVAVDTGLPYHSGISAAKGALEGLSRTLAAEFSPTVRVNCLALSLTDTPLAANLLSTEDKRKASSNRHPLKRVGDAEEVAKAASFLLHGDSGFMTGQVMKIDGGISTLKML